MRSPPLAGAAAAERRRYSVHPLEGVSGCPASAAADDGTLALVGSGEGPTRILVRRFGAFERADHAGEYGGRPGWRSTRRLDGGRLGRARRPRRVIDAPGNRARWTPDADDPRTDAFPVARMAARRDRPRRRRDGGLVGRDSRARRLGVRASARAARRRQRTAGRTERARRGGPVHVGRRARRGDAARVGHGGRHSAQDGAGEPVLVSPAACPGSPLARRRGAAIIDDDAADELVLVDRAPAGASALPVCRRDRERPVRRRRVRRRDPRQRAHG